MHAFILITLSLVLTSGSAVLIIATERRAVTCPRPDDATVTAVVTVLGRPSDGKTGVMVTVANPGPVPVPVGMTLRRQLLPGGMTVRRRYRAGRQAAVAAVPEEAERRLWIPVPRSRGRYRLTVVIEQSGRRLRVVSAPIIIARPAANAAPGCGALPPAQPWLRRTA